MIQTTIESIDVTGREIPPAPELRQRVERAAVTLEKQLDPLKSYPIESHWRIVHQPGSEPRVQLTLTTTGAGVRDWLFQARDLDDDARIHRAIGDPFWAFGMALSGSFRADLERMHRELKELATPISESEA